MHGIRTAGWVGLIIRRAIFGLVRGRDFDGMLTCGGNGDGKFR